MRIIWCLKKASLARKSQRNDPVILDSVEFKEGKIKGDYFPIPEHWNAPSMEFNDYNWSRSATPAPLFGVTNISPGEKYLNSIQISGEFKIITIHSLVNTG